MRSATGGGVPWLDRRTLLVVVAFVIGAIGGLLGDMSAPYIQELTGLTGPRRVYALAGFVFCSLLGLLATWLLAAIEVRREQAATTPAPTSHTLRPPVADLTGRDAEIGDLMRHLADETIAGPVAVIRGMGGVGKTEFALAVAHRLAPRCPNAQLWFELQPGGKATSKEQLVAAVVRAIRPEVQLPNTFNELLSLYRATLAGKQGLLLLDNAADAAQVQDLLPPPAGWVALVTSQHRFGLDGACPCDLDVLSREQAQSFLRTMFAAGGREAKGEQVATLAQLCGRLPLALRLAGEYLTTYDTEPVDGYLEKLRVSRLRHLASKNRSVAATLALSMGRLEREDGRLAGRWRQLAVFPAPFDLAGAAAIWDLSNEEAQDTLNALRERSLVEYHKQASLYSLHDLVRALALLPTGLLRSVPGDQVSLRWRHATYYLALGERAHESYARGGDLQYEALRQFDAVWPHLWAAWGWVSARRDKRSDRWLVDFPSHTARILHLRLPPSQQVAVLLTAVKRARNLHDRAGEAVNLGNLGLAYFALSDYARAIRCFEDRVQIAREVDDPEGEGIGLAGLGNVYLAQGNAQGALGVFQQRLAIARTTRDRRGEFAAHGSIGNVYLRFGDPRTALTHFEKLLEGARALGDRQWESIAISNLATAHAMVGNPHLAARYLEQQLRLAQSLRDARGEALALSNLGMHYNMMGDARRAVQCHQQALTINRDRKDLASQVSDLRGLGNACFTLRQLDRATQYHREASALSRELGIRHEEASALGNLAGIDLLRGYVPQAMQGYAHALAIEQETGNRRGQAHALLGLGKAHSHVGLVEEAIQLYEQALAIYREVGDSRWEADTRWELGLAYERKGDLARAALELQARVGYERKIGHPDAERCAQYLEDVRHRAEAKGNPTTDIGLPG